MKYLIGLISACVFRRPKLDSQKKKFLSLREEIVDFIPTFLSTQFLDIPHGSDVCIIESKSPRNLFASMFPGEISEIGRNLFKFIAPPLSSGTGYGQKYELVT